jgi:pimeloyl-ACP methyl ester carboxylesterase
MLLDDRPEMAGPLREHLGETKYVRYRRLAEDQARRREASEGRDHVVLIPGFAGSELLRRRGSGRSTKLWVNPMAMMTGGVADLACGSELRSVRVLPGKPLVMGYSKIQEALRRRWEVLEFGYDWRKDLFASARELHEFLAVRLAPGTPCHLVAHGSGGLLVRALIVKHPDTWHRLVVGDRGGRAVMLGTPHHGWFPALTLLVGQEPMLRTLAMVDLMHNLAEVRTIFASFPALYQMLPSPDVNPAWSGLYESASYGTLGVPQDRLDLGSAFHEALRTAVDPARMFNLLGHRQATTCDVEQPRQVGDGNTWALTTLGDGRVTHALARVERNGVPVPTWYVDETHSELPNNGCVLGAVDEILRWGRCFNLSELPGGAIEKTPIEEKLSER